MSLRDRLVELETQIPEASHARVHPTGWEPGILYDPTKGGTLTAGPYEDDIDDAIWDTLIEDWGLNRSTTEVVPGSVQVRAWDANLGKTLNPETGEIENTVKRFKYYRATLRPRQAAQDTVDLEALYKDVLKAKPGKKTYEGAETFLVLLSDWQCVDGSTIVLDRDGSASQIKDRFDVKYMGVKESVRLRLAGGGVLYCTPDHLVWTQNAGWVEAQHSEGHKVGTLRGWSNWEKLESLTVETTTGRWQNKQVTEVKLNEDFAALLGYVASDGTMCQKTHSFTNNNLDYIEEVKSLSASVLGSSPVTARHDESTSGMTVHFTGNNGHPSKILEKIGVWDEKFPTSIFRTSPEVAGVFLNRLWAGDGSIHWRGRNGTVPTIELAAGVSEVFSNYVITLLNKLGISARISYEWMKKSTTTFHRILINNGVENVEKFFSVVGLIKGKEKASQIAIDYYSQQTRRNRTTTEFEPIDGETLEFRKVMKIEHAGQRDVYDITVPEKHWFIANGMKVHNCGNPDGLGLDGQIEALANLVTLIPERVKALRKSGRNIGSICIAGLGDLVESCTGFYAAQQFRVEADRREQVKIVRRALRDIIMAVAPLAPDIKVVCVPGNHGENRQNGKAFTRVGDNDDVAVFEQVAEILAVNPGAFGHIQWRIPSDEIAVSVELSGLRVGFTHGHVAKSKGNAAETIWGWWKDQSFGRAYPGVADSQMLCAGHYHHFNCKEQAGRTVFVTPSLTEVSEYFSDYSGMKTAFGTVSMVVSGGGWSELSILK